MTYEVRELGSAARRPAVRQALALALVAASGGLLAASCADNESSLIIRGCLAAEASEQDRACVVSVDSPTLWSGTLDLLFQSQYDCSLRVNNQIVPRGDPDTLRTETSRVWLYSADVRLTDQAGGAIAYGDGSAVEYSVPISGFVDVGAAPDPGTGIAAVQLIDPGSADAIGAAVAANGTSRILANVIVYGRTLGGQEIATPEWAFPIDVCIGCACFDPPDDSCEGSEDGPESFSCSTDFDVDCRQGSRFAGASCGDKITAALGVYGGGGP